MLPDSAFAKPYVHRKSQAEHQWISPFAIDTLNSEFDNGQTGFLRVQLVSKSGWARSHSSCSEMVSFSPTVRAQTLVYRLVKTHSENHAPMLNLIPRAATLDYKSSIGVWSCGLNTLNGVKVF